MSGAKFSGLAPLTLMASQKPKVIHGVTSCPDPDFGYKFVQRLSRYRILLGGGSQVLGVMCQNGMSIVEALCLIVGGQKWDH